jgi:hypothetical protein
MQDMMLTGPTIRAIAISGKARRFLWWKHAGGHEIIRIPPQRRRAVSRALNSVDADQFAAKMASLRSAIVAFIAVQRIGAIVGIPILPGLHHHYVRM